MVKRYVLSFWIAAVTMTSAGCSLLEPPLAGGTSTVSQAPAGEGAMPAPDDEPLRALNPAAAQLIAAADNWQDVGDTSQAGAALERAIRFDPGHPLPWLELARLRLQQGDVGQAENLALKARNLAPRDSTLFADAEALVVKIQKMPL